MYSTSCGQIIFEEFPPSNYIFTPIVTMYEHGRNTFEDTDGYLEHYLNQLLFSDRDWRALIFVSGWWVFDTGNC